MSAYPDGVPESVCDHFERITKGLMERGFTKHSADAILHRIRWYERVENNNRTFKCNNNWTALLARWFIERHPEANGFFDLRESRAALLKSFSKAA